MTTWNANLKSLTIATLAIAFTVALTGCPNPIDSQTSRDKQTAEYAGVWVRAIDYCDYMAGRGYGPTDYRCDDIQWEENNSIAAVDEAWLLISISHDGGINTFGTSARDAANGNWGLGYITPEGNYVGYLTTVDDDSHPDIIRALADGDSFTLFTDAGQFTNRVGFLRITENDARSFEDGYLDCGKMGYCKGKHKGKRNGRGKTRR